MNAMHSVTSSAETVLDVTARLARTQERRSTLACSCASSLEQVEAAWSLVYQRYTHMGLIGENPFGIHANPTGVGPHACVIWGPAGADVGYTMSLFRDSTKGLALDSVYAPYLNKLRGQGRQLLEVGMLADRRENAARGMGALFNMMRWAIYYGLHTGVTDIVIGVHPRHAGFYIRCYGFEKFAPATTYALVRDNPVVLLRLRLCEELAKDVLPRGLADARDNPISRDAFAHRFAFRPEQLQGSRIAGFLKDRCGVEQSAQSHPVVNRAPVKDDSDDLMACIEA